MQLFASLREGSDGHNQAGAAVKLISIHAPAKGATHIWLFNTPTIPFQSTLPRRERRCFERFGCHAGNFNPRSREGSDSTPPDDVSMCLKFQSTLP